MNIRLMGNLNPYKKMNAQKQNNVAFNGLCCSKPSVEGSDASRGSRDEFWYGNGENNSQYTPEDIPDLNTGRRFQAGAGSSAGPSSPNRPDDDDAENI